MNGEKKAPATTDEQFPENFPTSARPVFRALILLVLVIGMLCYLVYSFSEHHPEPTEVQPLKKENLQKSADFDASDEPGEDANQAE